MNRGTPALRPMPSRAFRRARLVALALALGVALPAAALSRGMWAEFSVVYRMSLKPTAECRRYGERSEALLADATLDEGRLDGQMRALWREARASCFQAPLRAAGAAEPVGGSRVAATAAAPPPQGRPAIGSAEPLPVPEEIRKPALSMPEVEVPEIELPGDFDANSVFVASVQAAQRLPNGRPKVIDVLQMPRLSEAYAAQRTSLPGMPTVPSMEAVPEPSPPAPERTRPWWPLAMGVAALAAGAAAWGARAWRRGDAGAVPPEAVGASD